MKILSFFLLLFTSISILAAADSDSTITVYAHKLKEPLDIDGNLNESVYQILPITKFTQKEPVEGLDVSEDTEAWIFYDESNIYFCGRFYDTQPDSIDLSLLRRDKFSDSDWFWIFIDPYKDNRTGYYFAVNSGGSISDGTLYNDGWKDSSWDGIWEAESSVDSLGWYAEVRIPFTQLRFNEAEEMTWGINLNRDIKRKHEYSYLVMVPKLESGFVSKFADLKGLKGIKPKQRIELLPYIVQRAQFLRHDADDPFYKSNQYLTSFGGDVKISIGSNLNLDATFNPDFGQVEVDPAIVNLSAFENFFSEKRPFFIEGANTFEFGRGGANNNWGYNFGNPTLFYSRRIGRTPQGDTETGGREDYPEETKIIGAAKLTGKFNESWSIGLISAVTEQAKAKIFTDENKIIKEAVEPLTHYGVLRSQKQFNNGSQAVGFIFTSVNRKFDNLNLRNLLAKDAFTFGLDGWTFLDKDETYVLTASIIGSYLHGTKKSIIKLQEQPYRYFQRPDKTFMPLDSNRTSLAGMYSRVTLNKQKGNFYFNTAVGTATPGFEYNDLGSQWFADRINAHLVTGYRWYQPDNIFRRKQFYASYSLTSNYDGDVTDKGFYLSGGGQFINFWGFNSNLNYYPKTVSVTLTRGGPKALIPESYSFSLRGYTDNREKIVFRPFGGFSKNGIGGYSNYYGLEIEWKPLPQIEFEIEPEYDFSHSKYQWVTSYDDASALFGKRYVFANIDRETFSAEMRLNWSFNPKISLQLFVQPLFTIGKYKKFKSLAKPNSIEYMVYGDNGSTILSSENKGSYTIDADGAGPASSETFDNPDFNFTSLRSNLVLRWELLPGSILYFVWTHDKLNEDYPGNLDLKRDFTNVWKSEASNVFLMKFSYWFDV